MYTELLFLFAIDVDAVVVVAVVVVAVVFVFCQPHRQSPSTIPGLAPNLLQRPRAKPVQRLRSLTAASS